MRRRTDIVVFGLLLTAVLAAYPALAAEPATVTIVTQATAEGAMVVTATVVDSQHAPVADVTVSFKARTAFGWLTLAKVLTDQAGRAQIKLPFGFRTGEIVAEAGESGEAVRASVRLAEHKVFEPRERPYRAALSRLSPQPGFISPDLVPLQVFFLGVIVGGIWTTYGYVVSLLIRIWRGR